LEKIKENRFERSGSFFVAVFGGGFWWRFVPGGQFSGGGARERRESAFREEAFT